MYAKIPLKEIKKIALVQTNGKKTIAQVKKEQGCQYVLNGTLYNFSTFKPQCPCRIDGQTLATSNDGYWSYAFNNGADIQMIHSSKMNSYKTVISCSAMLRNGNDTYFSYNKDQGGIRGRSAIGIDTNNNLVLVCSKDGTKEAMSPEVLRAYMRDELKCRSAIMLDSGGSSSCDFDGKKITTSRKVANYICVWTELPSPAVPTCPYREPILNVRRDSRGDGVKWVQWYLNIVSDARIDVDGIFGSASVRALQRFQRTHGLIADGVCGKQTREALKDAYLSR